MPSDLGEFRQFGCNLAVVPMNYTDMQNGFRGKGELMRGPGYKLSGDVRRTWRCPTCGNERKLHGEVTSLQCSCSQGTWMRIVAERLMEPRPLQRPSDVEQRPIDFGIEAPPPQPARPEATIIKSAVSREPEPTGIGNPPADKSESLTSSAVEPARIEIEPVGPDQEEWGEGIL